MFDVAKGLPPMLTGTAIVTLPELEPFEDKIISIAK